MDKQEFIDKVSSAKTADEIFAIAKENGVEIPADKAEEIKSLYSEELTDDKLEAVSGGNVCDCIIEMIGSLFGY